MLDSVRIRLTLWHIAVLAILLSAFSTGVYLFLREHFLEREDGILRSLGSATISIMRQELSENGLEELAARKAISTLEFPKHDIMILDDRDESLAERPPGLSARFHLAFGNIPIDRKFHMVSLQPNDAAQEVHRAAVQRVILEPASRTYTVIASRSLTPLLGELETDRLVLGVSVPVGLLLAGIAGWFLSRKSLAPVTAMSEQARRIGAENLEQRLAVENPRDELGRLAATFNDLLSRLNAAFAQQRQFMADASHELRTPISVIGIAASVTLERQDRTEEEYRAALTTVDEQSRRLRRIVDDMFGLARADAGRLTLHKQLFYLDELLGEVARAAAVLASPKRIAVRLSAAAESPLHGDEDLLRRMLLNLAENAVKYTPEEGWVELGLVADNGRYRVRISDNGVGIPRDAQALIFERFFRVDKGRSRNALYNDGPGSGAGLGLSIAQSIAEAHDGTIELRSSDERGSTFEAVIPRTR